MKVHISSVQSRIEECIRFAIQRWKEQRNDADNGDTRASYSFGKVGKFHARSQEDQIEDHVIGALAECIAGECSKTFWRKETGQYKGNTNPDLKVIRNGKVVYGEVRGTRKCDSVIYRERDKHKRSDDLLIGVTSLPYGPVYDVGWETFGGLKRLVAAHPEWKGRHPGTPFYWVPFNCFCPDFSEF